MLQQKPGTLEAGTNIIVLKTKAVLCFFKSTQSEPRHNNWIMLQQKPGTLEAGTNIIVLKTKAVLCFFKSTQSEPRHNKTNQMTVRQAKTQISLGIRPV